MQNDEKVSQAIETASSRGGDQAVVKYKGSQIRTTGAGNVELESLNEVKARVVANQLKDLILSSSKVLVMGHPFRTRIWTRWRLPGRIPGGYFTEQTRQNCSEGTERASSRHAGGNPETSRI